LTITNKTILNISSIQRFITSEVNLFAKMFNVKLYEGYFLT